MLISRKVIELNYERQNSITRDRDETRSIYNRLNIFNKSKIDRIDSMIFRLYYSLERISGWTYTPSSFVHKSNYKYNPMTNEITFDIDRVVLSADGYKPESNNQYEQAFINTYKEQLDRLFILHKKREKILSPYKEEYKNFIINFNSAINKKKDEKGIPIELDILAIESNRFIQKFGIDGIKRLINLLNELAETKEFDPLETYNNQFQGNITNLYVNELFRWASSFTPKAQYIVDILERKREELDRELTPELREKIR